MKKLVIILGLIIVGWAGWYLGSPLFIDEVVEEDFPEVEHKVTLEMMEKLTVEEVDAMPEEEREEMQKKMNELAQEMPDHVMDEPMADEQAPAEPEAPAGPVTVVSGTFQDADSSHQGSGQATIFTLADQSNLLRLEDFSVTNGPALSVWLTKDPNGNPDAGYLDLGKLKGNIGNQNYTIPPATNLDEYKAVIIWCVPFRVLFAHAPLSR